MFVYNKYMASYSNLLIGFYHFLSSSAFPCKPFGSQRRNSLRLLNLGNSLQFIIQNPKFKMASADNFQRHHDESQHKYTCENPDSETDFMRFTLKSLNYRVGDETDR